MLNKLQFVQNDHGERIVYKRRQMRKIKYIDFAYSFLYSIYERKTLAIMNSEVII